ncbi:MAG TPA: hypothetical protein PLT92_14725 [Ignavibacteriaceae bacterium]|jgi:hypothetical protein|nr:hypothetical protein [Ignavibacterium sp.]HOJ19816.1 hypothetical protein [Ignavibacteriaceae bacterium]
MKQYEAVIEVMKSNSGYSTLGNLYQEVFKIEKVKWGTKTPFASIRRIVQDDRYFFKIKPGLWALKEERDKVLKLFDIQKKKPEREVEFNHSYYQGLLLEIGKLKKFQTFIPNQDKNKKYLERPLKDFATIEKYFNFTYDFIIDRASRIDVSWFNERNFPQALFEVEYSTDFKNSLLKFLELQDFNVDFRIVSDKKNQRQFKNVINYTAFKSIEHRVKFLPYDIIAELHTKTFELSLIEKDF